MGGVERLGLGVFCVFFFINLLLNQTSANHHYLGDFEFAAVIAAIVYLPLRLALWSVKGR